MIGVLLDLNSLVEDGIGRLGYGKKVKDIHLKCIIRNGCSGKLKKKKKKLQILALSLTFPSIRVTSSIYSADARFVLTGSDDGNVRIWKAKASDKLGVITARERAAMEYRESLKERWKVDSEVNKVTRSVLYSYGPLYSLISSSVHPALAISQNQCTKLQNSNEQCWKLSGSKRRGEENIRGKEKPIRNRKGRSWLLRNRAEMFLSEFFLCFFLSIPVRWFDEKHPSQSPNSEKNLQYCLKLTVPPKRTRRS